MGTDIHGLIECRGLPAGVSQETLADFEPWSSDATGTSWITWAELAATDWNEAANEVDDCVHEYRRSQDGTWELHGRNTGLDRFAQLTGLADPHALYRAGRVYPEDTEWPDADRLFRVGRLRRKHAVPDSEWGAVWSVMRTLAGLHGDEGVRLVVWFDG
ncbi:hypothetical protein ACFWA6_35950 [Streptomyces sp. NPDC060020]|uniref:hypothetical protein n=1 Tax=Streptomyces sp. NPDC060020 TaxID=3347038 RepID=UPI003676B098